MRPSPTDRIFEILQLGRSREYGGESVSQLEHALQCASLAEQAGSTPALITAALLHDLGHLLNAGEMQAFVRGEDGRHEARAESYLSQWFGHDVTRPVLWHVAAKRYLTATDPDYYGQLSPVSKRTLMLQGGPFDAAQAEEFRLRPYAEDALILRRWDELAKVPGLPTPGLEHFRAHVTASLTVAAS